jgi:cation-transporting ATPase 13A1
MITGDSPLTACHVARELKMVVRSHTLIFNPLKICWESIDETIKLPFDGTPDKDLVKKYDLCLTGDGLLRIMTYKEKDLLGILYRLLPFITVHARMAPKQKEWIINSIKARGYFTLMCGDGTNDVGALKHAHVGVAILSNCPEWLEKKQEILDKLNKRNTKNASSDSGTINGAATSKSSVQSQSLSTKGVSRTGPPGRRANTAGTGTGKDLPIEKQLTQMLKELEEQERSQVVKLGDASVAAPFSSKMSSIECICHVIKQGRCTLVTTLQMFKILALNALILAYSQSVLYLDGVKLSDSQATFHGLLLAACFFFISHSKPLKILSKKRPLPNIFNVYTLLTVFLQFFLHFFVLIYLVQMALSLAPEDRPAKVDLDKKFQPNLLNSVVYIISLTLQVTTFLVNYRGHPFMESITENKPFFYSIMMSSFAVIGLVTRSFPEFNDQFEIVPIPYELQKTMLALLFLDVIGAFILDRVCMWLFGEGRLRIR